MNPKTQLIIGVVVLALAVFFTVNALMDDSLLWERLNQGGGEVLCSVNFRTDKPSTSDWQDTYKYITPQGGIAYQKVRISVDRNSDGVLETYIYDGVSSYQCLTENVIAYSHEGDAICTRPSSSTLYLVDNTVPYSSFRRIFNLYTTKPLPSTTSPLDPYKSAGQEVYEPLGCVFELTPDTPEEPVPEEPEAPNEPPAEEDDDVVETPEDTQDNDSQPVEDTSSDDWEETEDDDENTPSSGTTQGTDSDSDGVQDHEDFCLDTPQGDLADDDGCGATQRDTDGDGVLDSQDYCPNTAEGEEVDANGCGTNQTDSDGDSVPDEIDLCPEQVGPYSNLGCPTGGKLKDKTLLLMTIIIFSIIIFLAFLSRKK